MADGTLLGGLRAAVAADGGIPRQEIMSKAALARYAGVSAAAVTKNKDKLVINAAGQVHVQDSIDRLARMVDPGKALAQSLNDDGAGADLVSPDPGDGTGETLPEIRRRIALLDEEDRKISLAAKQRRLRPIEEIQDVAADVFAVLDARFKTLVALSEELEAAGRQGGVAQIRARLRQKAHDDRAALADALEKLVETYRPADG